MPLPLPTSLSPSKVSSFTDCGLAFRFSAIDHLPEPPSVAATRGTLVHAALERLFCLEPAERTHERALACLEEAIVDLREHPEYAGLELDDDAEAVFHDEARALLGAYFRLEDPTTITPIGLELKLEVEVGGVRLRGIIDRLELDADGELVVTDYKTGKAPGERQEQQRLAGVAFYSLLCERLFGRRPARVQLALPGRSRRHHLRAHRSLHPRRRAQAGRHLDGDRAGLRARGLPPQPGPAVRLVRVQGLLPVLRRRHRPGRRLPHRLGARTRHGRAGRVPVAVAS